MTSNYHTPHAGDVVITDGGTNFNRPLGELDQAMTDFLAGDVVFENGIRVGAGTNQPSALFQMDSTTMGWGLPVLTTAERDAITNPPVGLMLFNSTTKKINFYTGSAWKVIGAPATALESIASGSFSAAASTTISSIPQTYTDLRLQLFINPDANDAGETMFLRFNADNTAGNYSYVDVYDNTATFISAFSASQIVLRYMNQKTSNAANIQTHKTIEIFRYAQAVPKLVIAKGGYVLSGALRPYATRGGGSWHKSGYEAITSLTFGSVGGVNTSGKYVLYGRP